MKIHEYLPARFEALYQAFRAERTDVSLLHRPFVDYYYASDPRCRLSLFCKDDGSIIGTHGVERLTFAHAGRELTVGFGSSFHALRPGAGGYLFRRWVQHFPVCCGFGGTEESLQLFRHQKWTFYDGIKSYLFNRAYPRTRKEGVLRALVKWGLERTRRRLSEFGSRIPREVARRITVVEEAEPTADMLPAASPFTVRFAPCLDHLRWRYRTGLSFVRYRLFRILAGRTVGYVILNDLPDQVLVAQCDGEDPTTLAYGVLLSVLAAGRDDRRPREVTLTCAHPEMQRVFVRFGFKEARRPRPFALGSLRNGADLPPSDTSGWLVNYDIGDNGLRPPFLDQVSGPAAGSAAGVARAWELAPAAP